MHLTRRAQEYAERGGDKLIMVLLDREKAFDKVKHEKLFEAMQSMGIDDKRFNRQINL